MNQIKQFSMQTLKETLQKYCSYSAALLDHPLLCWTLPLLLYLSLAMLPTQVPVLPLVWEVPWQIHSTYVFVISPQKYDYGPSGIIPQNGC